MSVTWQVNLWITLLPQTMHMFYKGKSRFEAITMLSEARHCDNKKQTSLDICCYKHQQGNMGNDSIVFLNIFIIMIRNPWQSIVNISSLLAIDSKRQHKGDRRRGSKERFAFQGWSQIYAMTWPHAGQRGMIGEPRGPWERRETRMQGGKIKSRHASKA